MATCTRPHPHTDLDDDRAATVRGLVEILVRTAAPAPLRRLRDAVNWLTWRVCNDAVEFVCAIGRPIAPAE